MASGILTSFLGAVQASLSVLLTIGMGVLVSQFGLVSTESAKEISHMSVKFLLPCLLIVNLGTNLDAESVVLYVPIAIWAGIYTILSIIIGHAVTAMFGLPNWTVPALAFNNTESLPLLLLESLGSAGVLASLVGSSGQDAAIDRARSFFLAGSVVTNTVTFGRGPQIITQDAQHTYVGRFMRWAWLRGGYGDDGDNGDGDDQGQARMGTGGDETGGSQGQQREGAHSHRGPSSSRTRSDEENGDGANDSNERTSLLPHFVVNKDKKHHAIRRRALAKAKAMFEAVPAPIQHVLRAMATFVNAPMVGASIGIFIGLIPPLKRLFFNDMDEGGYLNAWLTASIKNVGKLFVSLQVVVVGVKLSLSLRRMKEGQQAGHVPKGTIIAAILIRFVLWPVISISLVWALAAHTSVLPEDPVLWFAMMIMPVGPSAMKLLALAEVSQTSEKTQMAIARFLTISYLITPIIAFAVVGALKASESAMSQDQKVVIQS